MPAAYTAFYQARFTQQATSGTNISVISPDELIRFYQAYNIAKDVQYREPVTRHLSVRVRVVQLSVIFLAIALLVSVLILLGLIRYGLFAIFHWPIMVSTPQSKLDWMIHSIQTEDQPPSDGARSRGQSVMVSPVTGSSGLLDMNALDINAKKREFETAIYCERGAVASLATGSVVIANQATSLRSNDGYGGESFGCIAEVVQNDKTPTTDSRYP